MTTVLEPAPAHSSDNAGPTAAAAIPAANFAWTKIRPPRQRGGLVARAALETRLAQAVATHRLVLICAPAGYGKSVTLARALADHPADATAADANQAVAWLACDDDDDVSRWLSCLAAALDPYDLPWRMAPDALSKVAVDGERGLRAAGDALLNTLAATDVQRGVIVVEDAHRLADRRIYTLLDRLLERLPEQWSVVITSRVDPPLALARLRARGELAEFRQQALRFTPDEVAELVRVLGGSAEPPALSQLVERTQGWAAALRLSLQAGTVAAARPAAVNSERHLFDYLAAEVFDSLPAALQQFLLRTAVLPELSAPRCIAVSGDAQAALWLQEIEQRGLFAVVLDSEGSTLRLHDLFRDFLLDRLRRLHPDDLPELLLRAAQGESDPVRRVTLLIEAGALVQAQDALAQAAPALLASVGGETLLRLIERFPLALREGSPVLAFVRGMVAWPRFEWITMQAAMRRAGDGFYTAGRDGPARQARVFEAVALTAMGRLDDAAARLAELREVELDRDTNALRHLVMIWQGGARGPADAPAQHLNRMVDLLAQDAPAQVWYRCLPYFLFVGRPGMRAAIQRFVDLALPLAGDAHAPLRASAQVLAAWLALWQARLPDAQVLMEAVAQEDRWLGQPLSLRIPVLGFRAASSAMRGDREASEAACDAMIADVDKDPERRATWRGVYVYMAARLAAAFGDWDRARTMAELLAATPAEREWPFMQACRLAIVGQIALHEGRTDDALARLQPAAALAAEVDTLGVDADVRIALALALLRAGRTAEAWQALAPLAARVEQEGEPGGVLLSGRAALRELAVARWGVEVPAAGVATLQSWARLADSLHLPVNPGKAAPARREVLSERERDVLARIAAGDSNKLIARALDLSPHTVKRHVANILDKLDLASRGQAAAWYLARH